MRIGVFGDVMLGRNVGSRILNGVDILAKVSDLLNRCDINFCNLECPVVRRVVNPNKLFAGLWAVPVLKKFNAVTLANNHILDQGREGLMETLALLDLNGIAHTGAGTCKDEAFQPVIITDAGFSYALCGLTDRGLYRSEAQQNMECVAFIQDKTHIRKLVTDYSNMGCFLIALPHMGMEHIDCPPTQVRMQYHELIDSGFDMVIGFHPHAIQGMEIYNNKIVIYSLGDFVFDSLSPMRRISQCVLMENTQGEVVTERLVTNKTQNLQVVLDSENNALARVDGYLKHRYSIQFRLIAGKASNQRHQARQAIAAEGLPGLVRFVSEKIKLVRKRIR